MGACNHALFRRTTPKKDPTCTSSYFVTRISRHLEVVKPQWFMHAAVPCYKELHQNKRGLDRVTLCYERDMVAASGDPPLA